MMNYKKPTFWISGISIVIVVIVAVCFATSPKEKEADNEKTTPVANSEMETDSTGANPGETQTDSAELVWYDTFDFEGLDIQPRWYDFDGYMLYYAYDIMNNEDASVVTVDVKDATSEDFSRVYYKSSENTTEEGSRISMWVMIYLGEYRDFCEVTVGAKGDDKEYRLILPRNLDVNEQGMVEKVEKLKGRQHLNSNK